MLNLLRNENHNSIFCSQVIIFGYEKTIKIFKSKEVIKEF